MPTTGRELTESGERGLVCRQLTARDAGDGRPATEPARSELEAELLRSRSRPIECRLLDGFLADDRSIADHLVDELAHLGAQVGVDSSVEDELDERPTRDTETPSDPHDRQARRVALLEQPPDGLRERRQVRGIIDLDHERGARQIESQPVERRHRAKNYTAVMPISTPVIPAPTLWIPARVVWSPLVLISVRTSLAE